MAACRAYGEAGVTAHDVDVAEVHDCFTIAEILSYEALGFAPKGYGAHLLPETGRLPSKAGCLSNTGGGLVGFGHPVGALQGVKQMVEIWRQSQGCVMGIR